MAVWSSVEVTSLSHDFRLDAEHYQPEYLEQQKAIQNLPHVKLGEVANVSDGNHMSIAESFVETGVRYLRGQDLSDFFISDADPIYIPESTYQKLKRSHIFPGDVLVGIVGTIGSVGFVTERHGKLTANCKLAIIRSHSLPPEYIAIFLASRIGQNEIHKRIRGAVQMGLILPDLKALPVLVPTTRRCDSIVKLVREAKHARELCRERIEDAERVLTESLGLSDLDLSETLAYERDFADLQSAHRFGAEYFMPCKQKAMDALSAMPGGTLGAHCRSVRDLFDPTEARKGDMVRNFDLTDALEPVLDSSVEPMLAIEVGSTKKVIQPGDVVISRLRSYLREIALVRTPPDVRSVGSSEFIVLRERELSKKGAHVTPEALFIYLRSRPVQTILKWSQEGSQHPRFNEDALLAIPFPESIMKISSQIETLVNRALDAREKSRRLMNEAKTLVEALLLRKA